MRRRIFLDTSVVASWLLLSGSQAGRKGQKVWTRWRFVEKLLKSKHVPVLSPLVVSEAARAVIDSKKIWKLVNMGIPPAYFFKLQKEAALSEDERAEVYSAFWRDIDRLLSASEIVQDVIEPDDIFRLMLQTDIRTMDAALVLTAFRSECDAFVTSDRTLVSALSAADLSEMPILHVSNAYHLLRD